MATTTVRTSLALKGGLRLQETASFPDNAKAGATCFRGGVLYVRGDVGGLLAWFPTSAPYQRYVHTQGAAASVWLVNHGMTGEGVAVLAYDASGNVLPATLTTSSGMTSIDVGSARAGYAVAFGLAFATPEQGAKADSAVQPNDLGSAASQDSSAFASANHHHDNAYLAKTATAANASQLGGKPASDYLTVSDRIDLGEL
jgi:hypothetical protein